MKNYCVSMGLGQCAACYPDVNGECVLNWYVRYLDGLGKERSKKFIIDVIRGTSLSYTYRKYIFKAAQINGFTDMIEKLLVLA